MKKLNLLFFFLSLVLIVLLVACEQTESDPTSPGNEAPTIVLTVNPASIFVGQQVQFSITGTTDDQDEPGDLFFRWDFDGNGIWDEDWTLGLATRSHFPNSEGTFTVIVEARDTGGMISQAMHSYTAIPAENEPPTITLAITPSTIDLGQQLQFSIVGTTDDQDGVGELDFRWDFEGDGTWDEDWTLGLGIINWTPVEFGAFTVKVEARDTGGMISSKSSVYTVNFNNDPPVAQLVVTPQNGTTHTEFTFDASGSSDDHDNIAALTFRYDFNDDGSWDYGPTDQSVVTHTFYQTGTFFPKVQVTDQQGESSTSAVTAQTVEAPDLIITNIWSDDSQLEIGEYFTLYATFRNQGVGTAQPSRARIYWSHDDILNLDDDYYSGFYEVPEIAPGTELELYQVPFNPTEDDPEFDTEYIFIIVDFDEVLDESGEDNNVSALAVTTVPTLGSLEDHYYDDGSFETGFYWPDAGGAAAVWFNVPYDHYNIVGMWIHITDSPGYVNLNLFEYVGGGQTFGAATGTYYNIWLGTGWNYFDLAWEVDGSTDFGLGFTTLSSNVPNWSADMATPQYHSYYNQDPNTYGWSQDSTTNYGIRARIQPYLVGGAMGGFIDINPVLRNSHGEGNRRQGKMPIQSDR
jgi:PKD domain/CARDB